MELLNRVDEPRTGDHVAEELQVPRKLARDWLKRFVELKLRSLFERSSAFRTEAEFIEELRIPGNQVRSRLKRLCEEGVIENESRSRPVRYRSATSIGPLFDKRN